MDLPNEILLDILRWLEKPDLKSVRQANKAWSICAADLLFEKIYVSPHEYNLDIFTEWCANPVLARCVKTLEYDAAYFSPYMTSRTYLDRLLFETSLFIEGQGQTFHSRDDEIKQFVDMACGACDGQTEALAACANFKFLKDGLTGYDMMAKSQAELLHNGYFQETLATGLRRLYHLEAVILNDCWPKIECSPIGSSVEPRRTRGSPLARTWDIFQVAPQVWWEDVDEDFDDYPKHTDGAMEFGAITYALSISQKHIKTFKTLCGITSSAFFMKAGNPATLTLHSLEAYKDLKSLKLALTSYDGLPVPNGGLDTICDMLKVMLHLRDLTLILPNIFGAQDTPLKTAFASIFPRLPQMSRVTKFSIERLAISTRDLITVLLEKMPNLQHLGLNRIELLDGRWEGIFESLRIADRLRTLTLLDDDATSYDVKLMHQDKLFYPDPSEFPHARVISDASDDSEKSGISEVNEMQEVLTSLEQYVIDWTKRPLARLPTMSNDKPMEESLGFFEETLRLCEATGINESRPEYIEWLSGESERYQQVRMTMLKIEEST